MPQHSAHEQYLLELVNAERAKAGVQPLAFDNDLSEAAEGHSKWMVATDTISHTGAGRSSHTQRIKDAGYVLEGSWTAGENVAFATARAPAGYNDEVLLLHNNLMKSSGHRANILNPNYREVGLGFEIGDYKGRTSAFVTENFAKSGTDLFLTGVTFGDRDGDKFYDPGEGFGGVTITARSSSGATYKTTSSAAGGYDLALKPGSYTVTFSGPGVDTATKSVTIGTKNVKLDLVDSKPGPVAQVPDPVTPSEPAPAPQQPAPVPTQPSEPAPAPQPVGSQQWLSNFLSKFNKSFSWTRTLDEHEEGNTAPHEVGSKGSQVAFDGDSILFPQLRKKVAQLDDAVEQVRDHVSSAAKKAVPSVEWADQVHDHWGDGDALAAKLLEKLSAHNSGVMADQAA